MTFEEGEKRQKGSIPCDNEAEIEVVQLSVKEHQADYKQTTRSYEKAKKDSPVQVLEGARPCQYLHFRLSAFSTVRE